MRTISSPQAASKILVDYALSRFSTDNLSVMIVRFDAQKLVNNIATNIGVDNPTPTPGPAASAPSASVKAPNASSTSTDATSTSAQEARPSEADVIVEHARTATEMVHGEEAEGVKKEVMKQIDEEEKDAGPTMVKHDADEDLRDIFGGANKTKPA